MTDPPEVHLLATRDPGARVSPWRLRFPGWALYALFAGATAISFAPIFVRLSQVGPGATAFWRLALALPSMWLWMALEGRGDPAMPSPSRPASLRPLIVAGLLFAGDLGFWHWSIHYTTVANATLLVNFSPLFVALGSWLFFRQRASRAILLGMLVALLGMLLLVGQSFNLSLEHLWGDLFALVGAVFYAGYILAVKDLRQRLSTASIMAWSGLVTCLALLPVTLLMREGLWPYSLLGWLVLLALALFSHIGGQGLIAYALAHLPATFSAIALLSQPVMAALFAWLILDEALGPFQALGGVMTLVGIFIAGRDSQAH